MKTLLITLAFSVATLFATSVHAQSAGTAPADRPDRDEKRSDVSAIRKTVDDSRAAFGKRDLNTFATYFVNSPDLYYQVTTGDHQVFLAHGFENMKKMVGGYIKDNPTPDKADRYKATEPYVRVNGNAAFMSANGLDAENKENSQDFIVLEKINGIWKIVALTAQYYEAGKRMEIK